MRGGHLQTIWAATFRPRPQVDFRRERLELADGDFLDLDWSGESQASGGRVAILSHGLEGNSRRRYMLGMARALAHRGWTVLAWNMRGCSGEPNRLARSYHSGASDDLRLVFRHAVESRRPKRVAVVGFSLGGNLTLKFVAEAAGEALPELWRAVAISVPCDLASSATRLARWENRLYMRRFLRTLVRGVRDKAVRFPDRIDAAGAEKMRTFAEFDERFTAPLHGFADAADYWRRCSARAFLPCIQIPTLIMNARNDPFLPAECHPADEARQNPMVHLEMPEAGGHVGFVTFGRAGEYWSETRAAEFLGEE